MDTTSASKPERNMTFPGAMSEDLLDSDLAV